MTVMRMTMAVIDVMIMLTTMLITMVIMFVIGIEDDYEDYTTMMNEKILV